MPKATLKGSAPANKALLRQIMLFYLPLAATSILMFSSFSIMNSAMSRTASAGIALAAFALAQSVTGIAASPSNVGRQMLMSIGKNKHNFRNGMPVMMVIMLFGTIIIGLLGFTPLGKLVFEGVFSAPSHLWEEIVAATRLMILLPFVYTLRAASQAIIITARRTYLMTIGMGIRIIAMLALTVTLPFYTNLKGASVGTLVWVVGLGLEAALSFIFSIKLYKQFPEQPKEEADEKRYSPLQSFNFLWPIILTSFLWTFMRPVTNTGLALTAQPEQALATYQVASSFAWILIAFIEGNLHQITLVFGTTKDNLAYIRKFILTVSIAVSAGIFIMALTPLGSIVLQRVIGVDAEMAANSMGTILAIAFIPLILGWIEYYVGNILRLGATKALTLGKLINLITMAMAVFFLAGIFPQMGATAGAVAVVIGTGAELVILRAITRKYRREGALKSPVKRTWVKMPQRRKGEA